MKDNLTCWTNSEASPGWRPQIVTIHGDTVECLKMKKLSTNAWKDIDALIASKHVCGFCYTQLTDVEQEKNGVYYYDRRPKLDMKRIKAIFEKIPSRPAK